MFKRFPSRIGIAMPLNREFPFVVGKAMVDYFLNNVFAFYVVFVCIVGFNWWWLSVDANLRRERVIPGAADKIDMEDWVNASRCVEFYCMGTNKF